MLGKERAQQILSRALTCSKADQTEVILSTADSSLTRFANSAIHQNVSETNAELRVRVVLGKRIGVASTNDLSVNSIKNVIENATTIAKLQEENPEFVSLPSPGPIRSVNAYVEQTASFGPEDRAKEVAIICRKARENGLIAAGAFTTGSSELAVANSIGVFGYHPSTLADINMVIASEDSSGYADHVSTDVATVDSERLADEAVLKALQTRNPVAVTPGEYEVILEEYAANDILHFLAETGLSALAVQEDRSFIAHKFGQKLVGENVSIWDDGLDPSGLPMPFDYEGVPKEKVMMIDHGVAKNVVYDSYTASRVGKRSTGHALPSPNTIGPIPMNMFMAAGDVTKEAMLRSTKRGIWVTRFWYTRTVHPLPVLVTGMTRDGSFLIENGEITRPIKNMRFTQSYLEGLSNVEMISSDTKLQRTWAGANRVPALKIARWRFTSTTEY
ncbi:MAG: TldD/PmbA family protein [Chloroflexi bacterium]|nr:TldD/PmbA family protein [Chloroflexota bacterium]